MSGIWGEESEICLQQGIEHRSEIKGAEKKDLGTQGCEETGCGGGQRVRETLWGRGSVEEKEKEDLRKVCYALNSIL